MTSSQCLKECVWNRELATKTTIILVDQVGSVSLHAALHGAQSQKDCNIRMKSHRVTIKHVAHGLPKHIKTQHSKGSPMTS